jgi:hypothetical protein
MERSAIRERPIPVCAAALHPGYGLVGHRSSLNRIDPLLGGA